MGLFSFFSNMFDKNIECDSVVYDYIVYQDISKKYLYYNHNIVVAPDTNAVVVCRSKVCDVLPVGKYKVTSATLPNTFKKINFEKHEKKYHRPISKFKALVYFVNMRETHDFEFSSDEPFYFKSERFGKVIGFLEGKCTIRVSDSLALGKALLYGENTIDIMKVNENIGLWIGNHLNKRLEKSKLKFEDIVLSPKIMNDYFRNNTYPALDKIGFYISNIEVKSFRTSKKTQGLINEYILEYRQKLRHVKSRGVSRNDGITISVASSKSNKSVNSQKYHNFDGVYRLGTSRCRLCGTTLVAGRCPSCTGKR